MNQVGHQLLAATDLSRDQYGRVYLGQQFRLRSQSTHGGTGEEYVVIDVFNFAGHGFTFTGVKAAKGAPNRGFELSWLERLDDEVFCAEANCFPLLIRVIGTGEN
jgi:hypothetical protein